ncbi:hypothetical protein E1193_16405 [Micromonospora sp. KC606]|nr:hypothetical protein E1193_16405 [Micromonospora sp. KC606]
MFNALLQLNVDPTALARVKAGRDAQPTATVVDTQSVKTSTNPPTATQGTDAAEKIVGRERSVVTDTLGLLAPSGERSPCHNNW